MNGKPDLPLQNSVQSQAEEKATVNSSFFISHKFSRNDNVSSPQCLENIPWVSEEKS